MHLSFSLPLPLVMLYMLKKMAVPSSSSTTTCTAVDWHGGVIVLTRRMRPGYVLNGLG